MKRFSLILMLALTLCACTNEDDYNLPNDSEAVESFSITPDEAAGIALDFATAMREGEHTRTGKNEVLSVHNVQPLRAISRHVQKSQTLKSVLIHYYM